MSIHQPWVRPIVRGKATTDVEFGAKVAISVLNGYTKIERLSWTRTTYRTRDNLKYCAKHGIRMSGPKLGRPPKDKALYAQQCRDERREAGERNEVEGKFGTGKRCYGLDRLTARLKGRQ